MFNKTAGVIITLACASSIFVCMLSSLILNSACVSRVDKESPSPGNKYLMIIKENNCHATSPFNTHVIIYRSGIIPYNWLEILAPGVIWTQFGVKRDVFAFRGQPRSITAKWSSDEELAITYSGDCEYVWGHDSSWDGIRIKYLGSCDQFSIDVQEMN